MQYLSRRKFVCLPDKLFSQQEVPVSDQVDFIDWINSFFINDLSSIKYFLLHVVAQDTELRIS